MKDQTSISLRYLDTELYDRIEKVVTNKTVVKSKKDVILFALKDYLDMHDLKKNNNPYMIDYIRSIIESSCNTMERHLGGRLSKIAVENAIQISIMNRIILEYVGDMDNQINNKLLHDFRQLAVDDLKEGYKPLSYLDLVRKDETE